MSTPLWWPLFLAFLSSEGRVEDVVEREGAAAIRRLAYRRKEGECHRTAAEGYFGAISQVFGCLIHRDESVDFAMLRIKLRELAELERRKGESVDKQPVVAGEWSTGKLEDDEPKAVVEMRRKLRLLHYPISTERAYSGWLKRFMKHLGDENLKEYGAEQLAEFLTELALCGDVAASTQNQALSGILFYYRREYGAGAARTQGCEDHHDLYACDEPAWIGCG